MDQCPAHYPSHLDAVKPLVQDRRRLAQAHPIFEEMRSDVIQLIKTNGMQMPFGVAVLVARELLEPALREHWQEAGIDANQASAKVLVMYLPELFSGVVHEIATQQPGVVNVEQLNLRNNATYLEWSVGLRGEEEPTVVQLPEYCLSSVIWDACRYPTYDWGWLPVVVLTGDAVAIGGFVVEESFMMCLQAASISAQSCKPEVLYSEGELQRGEELAGIHGLEPWRHARWSHFGQWKVQPEMFRYTE